MTATVTSAVTPPSVTLPVTPPAAGVEPDAGPGDEDQGPGGIEVATAAYVASLGLAAGDPRAVLGQIAVKMARRVDRSDALPAAARELRVLVAQLGEVPGQPAGPVDELRVRRAQRRLEHLLAAS